MKTNKIVIIPLKHPHWSQVQKIYQEGIDTDQATFQTTVPTWEQWHLSHLTTGRLIAVIDEDVVGWAALSAVSSREVYKGVAEVSIYVDLQHLQQGIGESLMTALITASETNNIWTLQASMFPENRGSVRLHEKFDFRKVGTRKKIAQQHGVWRDTIIYERRSKRVLLT